MILKTVIVAVLSPSMERVEVPCGLETDPNPPYKCHAEPPADWWRMSVVAYCRRSWGIGFLMPYGKDQFSYQWVPL